jgi:antitoxin MazE
MKKTGVGSRNRTGSRVYLSSSSPPGVSHCPTYIQFPDRHAGRYVALSCKKIVRRRRWRNTTGNRALDKGGRMLYLLCRYVEGGSDVRSRIKKWGNSLALRIPRSFAAEAQLKEDSAVEVSLVDGRVVVTPIARRKLTLGRLLAGVNKDNLHGEVETGPAVGDEIW